MYSSLESIEARFLELEKNLCDQETFICPPRPPVPTWLFEIKSDDIKYEIAAGCSSVAGISTSSIIVITNSSTTDLSGNVTGSFDKQLGGLTPGSATIVASLAIAAVVVVFVIILVVIGCLRYHKKKKITPMSNGEPGNYLYNNQVKKRRWVGSGNPQIMAKHNMNGTTMVYDSPVHSERGEDVENGEETVPSERQQNDISQSQTFTGIVVPNTDNVTMETEDAPLQVKHKKRKKKKKKKRSAKTADSDGDHQNMESLPPRQLPPLSTETKPV